MSIVASGFKSFLGALLTMAGAIAAPMLGLFLVALLFPWVKLQVLFYSFSCLWYNDHQKYDLFIFQYLFKLKHCQVINLFFVFLDCKI